MVYLGLEDTKSLKQGIFQSEMKQIWVYLQIELYCCMLNAPINIFSFKIHHAMHLAAVGIVIIRNFLLNGRSQVREMLVVYQSTQQQIFRSKFNFPPSPSFGEYGGGHLCLIGLWVTQP